MTFCREPVKHLLKLIYFALRKDFRAHAIQAMSGTSGCQRVEVGQLQNFKLAIPAKAMANSFAAIVPPLQKLCSTTKRKPPHSVPCATRCYRA